MSSSLELLFTPGVEDSIDEGDELGDKQSDEHDKEYGDVDDHM